LGGKLGPVATIVPLTATAMSIRLREFSLPITLTATEFEERRTRA
jgi:hypothetical protein